MFYTVYKTTHIESGKIYVGSHKTLDLNDDYLGSGKYLKRAILKYGPSAFSREILHVFSTPEEMFSKEAEIVTEDFVKRDDTYNMKIGGFGGWDHIDNKGRTFSAQSRERMSKTKAKMYIAEGNPFYGKKHSAETVDKIRTQSLIVAKERYENSATHINKQEVSCPHCDKRGQLRAMKRWHFENCSRK